MFFLEIYRNIILEINLAKIISIFLIFFSLFIYSFNLLIISNIILNKVNSINKRIIIIYIY